MLHYISAILRKRLNCALTLPATILDYPDWRCKMHHCHNRGDMVCMTALQHAPVMSNLRLVKFPLLRFDTCPFDRKPVCGKPRLCHQFYVFFISIIMIHCVQRWFIKCTVLHVLHRPVIAVNIVSLHLMCRRGSTY